jgi:hypothetical protein
MSSNNNVTGYSFKCWNCGKNLGDEGFSADSLNAHFSDTGHGDALVQVKLPSTGLTPGGFRNDDIIQTMDIGANNFISASKAGPLNQDQQNILTSLESMQSSGISLTAEQAQLLKRLKDQSVASNTTSNLPSGANA